MLKLEYLPGGSDAGPLIRLYDFEAADLVALRDACLALGAGQIGEVSLDRQPWVRSVGGCRVTLRAGMANRGVQRAVAGAPFVLEWAATSEAWLEVAGRLDPLVADRRTGFQWLRSEGDVKVLVSWDGRW